MKTQVRIIVIIIGVVIAADAFGGVRDSLHNLSASGRGQVKSAVTDRICEFCHISHSASAASAIWSRGAAPTASYIPYSSTTAVARPGQPTGDSVLCLSCHDGTIALGQIINRAGPDAMAGSGFRMPPGKGLQGTDLRDDHPISFEYSSALADENGELAMPHSISSDLPLDETGQIQCTTCHDAHDSPYEKLLRMSNYESLLCIECHVKRGWSESSHSLSSATWNGQQANPWIYNQYTSVSENGCENCHLSHNNSQGPRLLKYALEEQNCSECHSGNVAQKDVMNEVRQFSAHRVEDYTLVHDPVESGVVESRHVECVDCHDPHASNAAGVTGDTPRNVRGINIVGGEVEQATYTYEICLRCHGDSSNQPLARTSRQHAQSNIRLKIQLDSPSFHPIAGIGRNIDVPSLIDPMTEATIIGCTDCHNSSSAESVGGTGPEGPHGSAFYPILARNYVVADNTPESPSNYALCYECHSRDSILNDESFVGHRQHIQDENTPCNVCHDPHGISSTQGNELNNSHLINFDVSIVQPNVNGLLEYRDMGNRMGSCDLSCHGKEHENFEYQP